MSTKDLYRSFKSCGTKLEDSKFLAALAEGEKDGAKHRKSLLFVMKDFAPYLGVFLFNHQGLIDLLNLPPADMVFLTLVNVCGNSYAGEFEKVAWSVAFCYKSVPYAFSLHKFGLRLYHHKDASPSREISEEMFRTLSKAMGIIEKLMEPVVSAQIAAGNVTLVNSFPQLNSMYEYFRQQAKKNFGSKPRPSSKSKFEDLGKLMTLALRRKAIGGYNTNAMIDAYFSRLEHLLVVLLAFVNYNRKKHDLVKVMGGFWSDKFKAIFDLEKDATAKVLYDRLIHLREQHRNPIAHGNFRKDGKSLYFHFGPVGAISCHLSNFRDRQKFSFTVDQSDYDKACALFDEVDKFLEKGITKYGFLYVRSGLNVAYDEKSINKYRAAAADEDCFNEFLKHQSYIADMHKNMDW